MSTLVSSSATIVARNYLSHARVLAESYMRHHPHDRFSVLLIDDESREAGDAGLVCRLLRLADVGFTRDEIAIMAAIYNVTEFSTAVKPKLLQFLMAEGAESVIYLDPDIKIFAPLEEAARQARQHSVVLTPHTMTPLPNDDLMIGAENILAAGVYNLGFITVGRGCDQFLEWWRKHTLRHALSDPARMMFTDQRPVDFVPCFYDHYILKNPSYNVAYWNLHGRRLVANGSGYKVDGRPLTFFHFSGFDHRKPYLLSKHQAGRPRILLSEYPALRKISGEYLEDLTRHGVFSAPKLAYGWDTFGDGYRMTPRLRSMYRDAVVEAEEKGLALPPSPFGSDGAGRFIDWLNTPLKRGPRTLIPRYLLALHDDRGDLAAHFPDLAGAKAADYLTWVTQDGVLQEHIPAPLIPSPALIEAARQSPYTRPDQLTPGLNMVGYFEAELGIGEAARLLKCAAESAGIPCDSLIYDKTLSRQRHQFEQRGPGSAPHDINVVCVNADMTPEFAGHFGSEFFYGRHTAGYWFWEVEAFAKEMWSSFGLVDEVWAATNFVVDALRGVSPKPVYRIPLPVLAPRVSPGLSRSGLGVPDGFVFLFVFDFLSVLERKNPLGLVEAFKRAFRPGEATLVLKCINGHLCLADRERLRFAVADRTDILVIEEYFSAEQKNALIAACDCYVSLHRSEGFGLTMAEAMALGKPVIATAYSGNMDFMSPESTYLVDYSSGFVPAGCAPYAEGTRWADPNLELAAEYMRRVYEDRDEATGRGQRARQDILAKYAPEACGAIIGRRLEEIRANRRLVVPARSLSPHAPIDSQPPAHERDLAEASASLIPTPGTGPSAIRPLRMAVQSALFRTLRPLWWQQRHVQNLLIQAVRSTYQTLSDAAAHQEEIVATRLSGQDERLGQVSAEVRRLVALTQQTKQDLGQQISNLERSIGAKLGDVRRRQAELEVSTGGADLSQRVDSLSQRIDSCDKSNAHLHQAVTQFQEAATVHLDALTNRLAKTVSETETLTARLYAPPYMSTPEELVEVGSDGRSRFGYRAAAPASSDHYLGFESVFRGSETFIRQRLEVYLPILDGRAPVLDAGCGRGEMLDLLRARGIAASGVDLDSGMVRHCHEKGLEVEHGDVIAYLRTRPNHSLGAVFAAQLIEHFTYGDLLEFLTLVEARLVPGGLLIAETINPHSLEAFKTFFTDLTHQRPIFPEVALALCRLHGYVEGYVLFPNGSGDLDSDRRTQGEYAVIATTRRS